jgi:hypothetical protein
LGLAERETSFRRRIGGTLEAYLFLQVPSDCFKIDKGGDTKRSEKIRVSDSRELEKCRGLWEYVVGNRHVKLVKE